MNFKPATNHCCGTDFTLTAPATIHDWIEALGAETCADLVFKMQCYTKANTAIRQALHFNREDTQRVFTPFEITRATEQANYALLQKQ